MSYNIREYKHSDKASILKIFNYYVENGTAAYPEEKVGMNYLDKFFESAEGYPFFVAENDEKKIIGFGLLHKFHPATSFLHTAEVTYFIAPEYNRQGIGNQILEKLIEQAKAIPVTNILASISSENEESLRFHQKNGFEECGRFKKVGKKFGRYFDILWMQKELS